VTTSGDNVERRVARLERDVARLREEVALAGSDASAARTLAAGADRDVSEVRAELRAHTQALNALRQTQLEQGQALERLQESVQQQAEVTSEGFTTVRSGMAQIVALLDPRPQR
jgi:isocitrate lyase